jgi:hypothetical protein
MKNLGVPFFGTRTELVKIPARDGNEGTGVVAGGIEEVKDDGRIEEKELVALQKKMLVILEDLSQG